MRSKAKNNPKKKKNRFSLLFLKRIILKQIEKVITRSKKVIIPIKQVIKKEIMFLAGLK